MTACPDDEDRCRTCNTADSNANWLIYQYGSGDWRCERCCDAAPADD